MFCIQYQGKGSSPPAMVIETKPANKGGQVFAVDLTGGLRMDVFFCTIFLSSHTIDPDPARQLFYSKWY